MKRRQQPHYASFIKGDAIILEGRPLSRNVRSGKRRPNLDVTLPVCHRNYVASFAWDRAGEGNQRIPNVSPVFVEIV